MEFFLHLAIFACVWIILTLSLNLILGYTGLISVTHAAFFGIGAYTTAILSTRFQVNFFLTIPAGMLIAAFLAFLVARVLRDLTLDYYVLGTVGFNYIMQGVFMNWDSLTGGSLGINAVPRPSLFGFALISSNSFFFFSLLACVGVFFTCRFVANSSFGRALKAIREDEKALEVFGYRTLSYKLMVFAIGGALAAIAGALYASYIGFVDPTSFTVLESVFILAMVILGGAASLEGSLIGAIILSAFPAVVRFLGFPEAVAAQMRYLSYGLILILLMLYRPQGIWGEYKLK